MVAAEKKLAEQTDLLYGKWTVQDFATVQKMYPDAPEKDVHQILAQAARSGLDPIVGQIMLSPRRKKVDGNWVTVWQVLTSIDGFRAVAEMTGKYAGQVGPFWCGSDGTWKDVWLESIPPRAAKVGVLRVDFKEPLWAVARYDGYAQRKDGVPTGVWANLPDLMTAKCAEALAIRRAFPQNLSGLYVKEEMDQADNDPPVSLAPNRTAPKVEQPLKPTEAGRPPAPTEPTATETLQQMKDTTAAFAQHMREQGALPPEQQPTGTPGAESEPQQSIPGQEVFPPSDEPVAPTEAQVKALTKAWDALGVAKDRRDSFFSQNRPWAAWESAIATLERKLPEKSVERQRAETMTAIVQTAQAKKLGFLAMAKALWPESNISLLKDCNDKQLAELLRKVKEA